ncbi:MAG: hypothetical protein ACO2ZM_09725 [Francisellaceae bacterium]
MRPEAPSNPQQQQQATKVGFAYLIIGGLLLAVGAIAIVMGNSVNGTNISKSIQSIYSGSTPDTPTNIYDGIIVYVLIPFLDLTLILGPALGVILLCMGLHRLRYHSNQQIMSAYRRSPMATGFYFLVGALMLYPYGIISALSQSLFQSLSISQNCLGSSGGSFLSYFNNLDVQYIIGFSDNSVTCTAITASSSINDQLIRLTYAVLFVVGFISFLRGIFMLTAAGEHMGGPSASVSKIVCHTIAGICAMNANIVIDIVDYTYQLIVKSNGSS